jgi:hypothetical protein
MTLMIVCVCAVRMQGANLMGKLLWTQAYRQEVWDSHINTNKTIVRLEPFPSSSFSSRV